MTDYEESINTDDFKYTGKVYFHNMVSESRVDYPIKLVLNESNFNFDFAKEDGSDFRLSDRSNGSGVLKMWGAKWDKDTKYAVLWFKIPYLSSDPKSTFYAFWGNSGSSDISTPDDLGFLFCEDFLQNEIGDLIDRSTWIPNWVNVTYPSFDEYKAIDGDFDTYTSSNDLYLLSGDFRIEIPTPIVIESIFFKLRTYNIAVLTSPIVVTVKTNVGDSWIEVGSLDYVGADQFDIILDSVLFSAFTDPIGFINIHFEVDAHSGVYIYEIIAYSQESKWMGMTNNAITQYGYLFPSDLYFLSTTNPLTGQSSWIMEAGVYLVNDTNCDLNDRAHGFEFIGDENGFVINMMHETRVEHNAIDPGGSVYSNIDQTYGGLEFDSYQEHYISYYEPEDRIYQRIVNRGSYEDIENKIDRKVEGDTRISNVRLHGRQIASVKDGAYPSYISWFVIREHDNFNLSNLDGSELYIQYENVEHQLFDYREYTDDLTSIDYTHSSSFGGDPYKMSNNATSDAWYSDEAAVSQDQIYVTIYFDRTENLVSPGKLHYNSNHEKYYGAVKMSDNDLDVHGRDHWCAEFPSAWAIISFGSDRPIVDVFGIKAVSDDLDSCPKNYKFYGGLEPYHASFKLLYEGTFEKTVEWQSVTFINKNPYKYYKFEIIDSYGDNIKVQEWLMYGCVGADKPKYISQLRLHPTDFNGLEYNFPKQIRLEGSNDMLNWEVVMGWTDTYTPYISHNASYGKWQRYSFTNIKGYWHYRLVCKGNWGASDGRIIIGEWEMCELKEEENIYRILGGQTNNIKQIWASDTCGFEDESGLIYIGNEKLNIVQCSKLVEEKDISEFYDDVNVVYGD